MTTFWELYSLITLVYIVPCYIFYIYFTIVLYKKDIPEFQTPFFMLIKFLAIIDLTLSPLFYVGFRLGHIQGLAWMFERASKPSLSITLFVYVFCVLQHSQLILHLIMAFNRFSATVMVKSYKSFWSFKRFWIVVALVFGLPCSYMSWLLVFGGYYRYGVEHQGFMLDNVKSGSSVLRKATMILIVGAITCFLSLILDTFTIIFLYKRRQKLKAASKSKYYSDIRLFGVSFILFLVTALYTFTELMLTLYAYTDLDFTYHVLFPLQSSSLDFVIFISPISVLVLNPRIRCHFLIKKRVKQVLPTPSVLLTYDYDHGARC